MRPSHGRASSATEGSLPPAVLALPPPLSPHALSLAGLQAVGDLLEQGQSPHTRSSYQSGMAYWSAWYALRYRQALAWPVPVAAVTQFIVDHVQRDTPQGLAHELPGAIDQALVASGHKGKPGPLALATVAHRVSVLSQAHEERKLANPCRDPAVSHMLARARHAYARRDALPQRSTPLERATLDAVLATCGQTLRDTRDRALLLFAWASGGRRRSEVAQADMRWLTELGPAHYQYELRHSKTNPAGTPQPQNFKPLVDEAAEALRAWLQAAKITEGPTFRSVRKGGTVGGALSSAAVREIVRRRCALAGLSGHFTAHSLRSGFVTWASSERMPDADIMELSGHHSIQGLRGYCRPTTATGTLRRMLERRP
ncbi:site-specific integrase [Ramlibacter tataouinensis]|uniref:site-specific integrase n=1 Tax=Ramlibacter tataouinensis TaxID=94132 RepID=UPI0022F3C2B4|nr:site-specific integrase [Ramlibacter tataouinensis]WBY03592.1 site-specific integrase [Ramlibacter tataouinensis]